MTPLRGRWVREVMRTHAIGDAAKVLLLAMAEDMDERGYVTLLRPVLAERVGRSERRVSERLSEAVEAKFLDHVRRGQKGVTPVYRAMLPSGFSETVYSPLSEVQRDGFKRAERSEVSPDRPAETPFSGTPGGPTCSKASGTEVPPHSMTVVAPTSEVFSEEWEVDATPDELAAIHADTLAFAEKCGELAPPLVRLRVVA